MAGETEIHELQQQAKQSEESFIDMYREQAHLENDENNMLRQEDPANGQEVSRSFCGCQVSKRRKKCLIGLIAVGVILGSLMLGGVMLGGYFIGKSDKEKIDSSQTMDPVNPTTGPLTTFGPVPKTSGTQTPKTRDCSSYAVVLKTVGETLEEYIIFKKPNMEDVPEQREEIIRLNETDNSIITVNKAGWYSFNPSICLYCSERIIPYNVTNNRIIFFKNGKPMPPPIRCYVAGHCVGFKDILLRRFDTVKVALAVRHWNPPMSYMNVKKQYCP